MAFKPTSSITFGEIALAKTLDRDEVIDKLIKGLYLLSIISNKSLLIE